MNKLNIITFLTILFIVKILVVLVLPTAFFTNLDNNFGLNVYRIYKPIVHSWRMSVLKDYKTDMDVHIAVHYSMKLNSDLDKKARDFYFSSFHDSLYNEAAKEISKSELNDMLFSSVMLADWERLRLLINVFDIDTKQTLTVNDVSGESINVSKYLEDTYGFTLYQLAATIGQINATE